MTIEDIEALDFAKGNGLLPAIVQDADGGAVLMLGYMDEAALRATFERKRVVFFSRSRQRLWEKGETSGNALELVALRADCDRDCILVSARPLGAVCHLGTRSCFANAPLSAAEPLAFLASLERVIEARMTQGAPESYTAGLVAKGAARIAQKVGEEGVELALAAVGESDENVIAESADLIFHLLILLKSRGIPLTRVVAELAARNRR